MPRPGLMLCGVTTFLLAVSSGRPLPAAEPSPAASPGEAKVAELIEQLGGRDFAGRERAARRLVEVGAPALDRLRRLAEGNDPDLAKRARACVAEIEVNVRVAELVAGLGAAKPEDRLKAANGFAELRVIPKTIVPALVRAMDDTDLMVQRRAVGIMWAMGSHGDVAIPKLVEMIEAPDTDEQLKWLALKCLGMIGPKAHKTIPVLLRVLESGKTMHRQGAADSLALLGKGDKRVVPALVRVLNSPAPAQLYGNAAGALGILAQDPGLAIPALVSLVRGLKGKGEVKNDPRYAAVTALGRFGEKGGPCVPLLIELATEDESASDLQTFAIYSLGEIGPAAGDAIPTLQKLLLSNNPLFQREAGRALAKIQPGR
jgi:HEAT repeat protein